MAEGLGKKSASETKLWAEQFKSSDTAFISERQVEILEKVKKLESEIGDIRIGKLKEFFDV